ncbi:MAG: hypothetical protein ABR955_03385 [Verrucomicrobiota bacterium]|jgi:hypothetical protein
MNLGKLLAAGKSIKNGQGVVAYRKDKRVYLPKFGSPKSPFTTKVQAELPKPLVENSVAPVKNAATPTWAKTQKMPTVSAGPARVTTWAEKFNPIAIWRGSAAEVKSSPHAIQAELSLEKVKVVHNDLTDVDVEVVPIKSRSMHNVPEPVFQTAVSVETNKNFWSRLDEKFFGANTA